MEARKPDDREPEQQQRSPDNTSEMAPEQEKLSPSLSPSSSSRGGGVDEVPQLSKEPGGQPKVDQKPRNSEAGILLSPTAAAAAKAETSGAVTDLQKKLQRAERFGVPVQLSEEEKRSFRAVRFGIGSTPEKSEELKRKARAERFGTGAPSLDDEAKKRARLERFGSDPKSSGPEEEEKKMKARAASFSQATTTGAPPQGDESDDKKESSTPDEGKSGGD